VFYHGVALFLVSDRFVQRWAPSQAHKQEDATMYLERQIQKIRPGQWAALEEIDWRFDAVVNELGFPTKRRWRTLIGGAGLNALIVEREWDSLSQMEEVQLKAFNDDRLRALNQEAAAIIEDIQIELYMALS
jgi:hypothetical protein